MLDRLQASLVVSRVFSTVSFGVRRVGTVFNGFSGVEGDVRAVNAKLALSRHHLHALASRRMAAGP